jgi:predicted 2-oxoglutarate/Fe(II)-dependent dioxygenase YbiX/peroxiredoxin
MRAYRNEIEPGDRAPNFVLPANDGHFRMFYERTRGRLIALLFSSGSRFPACSRTLRSFSERIRDLTNAGADVFCVSLDDVATLRGQDFPFLVWSDPKKAITRAYRAAVGRPFDPNRPEDDVLALVLDANQRVLAVHEGQGEELFEKALETFAKRGPAEDPEIRRSTAPVLVMPNLLDETFCRHLIDLWRTRGHFEGTVGSVMAGRATDRVYHQAKKRLDHKIDDQETISVLSRVLGRRLAPELEKAFAFEGFRFDAFLVVCYDSERGDRFHPHRDNISKETSDRRFAMTLNLNAEDYEGGELVFQEYGPHRYKPGSGGAVIFSCSLIHEALPVTKGRRFALLTFLREAGRRAR